MSRVSRHLGFVLALAAFAAPQAFAQSAQDLFREAVQQLKQGHKEEALRSFERALAADPSNEEAFQLWLETDREIMLDMLIEGGQFEKVAKRFLERASIGRMELERDSSAIQSAADAFFAAGDSVERSAALNNLFSKHGEYAVPALIAPLADESADDARVHAMVALRRVSAAAVLPVIEALNSESAFQRRNVAIVLGMIRDPRAGAMLRHLAETDSDELVRQEAKDAAAQCGATGAAADHFLQQGDEYHHRRGSVLRDVDYSAVVWTWNDGELEYHDVQRAIYNNELAKRAYYRALAARPDSLDAVAGIARESVDVRGKLQAIASAGGDVEAQLEQAETGLLAVAAAGPEALDRALVWSVQADDTESGARIARMLAMVGARPTDGLQKALLSGSAGLAGEAAVALAHLAATSNTAANAQTVKVLGDAAAREIVRVAAVIDGNHDRARAIVDALGAAGVEALHFASGGLGLARVGQLQGVDVILVGDTLPDLTADSVIAGLRDRPAFGETPLFLLSGDEELAEAFGDRINGSFAGVDGLSALDEIFQENLDGDRALADELAANAAAALAMLGQEGRTDLAGALDALGRATARRDGVAIPALAALGQSGKADQVGAVLAVVNDGSRSDEARIAAADALGAIATRGGVNAEAGAALREVLAGDASLPVRIAVARAVGRMALPGSDRAGVLQGVRVDVRSE